MVGSSFDLFRLVNSKHKVYVKQASSAGYGLNLVESLSPQAGFMPTLDPSTELSQAGTTLNRAIELALLKHYDAAAVIIDQQLEVRQFLGQTGAYLDPALGRASLNLLRLARPKLQIALRSAIYQAQETGKSISKANIYLREAAGDRRVKQQTKLTVVSLGSSTADEVFMVIFEEDGKPQVSDSVSVDRLDLTAIPSTAEQIIQRLQQELDQSKSHLQSIIEEQEGTNQDLRAANEEILSSNEELQSTNEELQTAKEEIQATNEELSTINEELYQRNIETTCISNDLQNLLGSTNIPILMVEENGLRIRRFTPTAADLFNLIPTDVGRPLNDIRHNLLVEDLDEKFLRKFSL